MDSSVGSVLVLEPLQAVLWQEKLSLASAGHAGWKEMEKGQKGGRRWRGRKGGRRWRGAGQEVGSKPATRGGICQETGKPASEWHVCHSSRGTRVPCVTRCWRMVGS